LQGLAAGDRPALRRRGAGELSRPRARGEVPVGVDVVEVADEALEPDLPVARLLPPEGRRGARVLAQLPALVAVFVAEELQAVRVALFQQHHAAVRRQVPAAGRQRHAVGLGDPGGSRRAEPDVEQLQRVGRQVAAPKRFVAVFAAHVGELRSWHGPRPGAGGVPAAFAAWRRWAGPGGGPGAS
jgi:hypothetical protein